MDLTFRQFRILLWRCFLLKNRQPFLTLIEIILPIFMAAFIAVVNHFDTQGARGKFELKPRLIYEPTNIFPTVFNQNEITMLYTPKTNLIQQLIEVIKSVILNETLNNLLEIEFEGIESEKRMIEKLKNETRFNVIGGVSFSFDDWKNSFPPLEFKYSLFMTRFDQENALFAKKIVPGPTYVDDSSNPYIVSNFVHIQAIINEGYLELLSNRSRPIRPTISINKFPYPEYIESPHIFSLKRFISRSNIIGFVTIVPLVIRLICGEKERRIKEMMELMGMNDFFYYCSVFLSHFTISTFNSIIITFIYFIHFSGKPLLQNACFTLVYFTLLLYNASLILFCMVMSTFFNRPVSGIIATLVLYISSFELPHNLMNKPGFFQSGGFAVPERAHLWSCLLPTVGMDWAFKIIVEMDMFIEGAQWSNLFMEIQSHEKINLGNVFSMIVFGCFIMISLIWYVDSVWPFQYGTPKPFYFPFWPSYWFGYRKRVKNREAVEETQTILNTSFFEEEPQATPIVIAEHLKKTYGSPFYTRIAVKDVSLKIYHGQITILLGHNGAGKTTTMSMLTGILPPTSGNITIDGFDLSTQTKIARKKIGLCPQHNVLYDDLTVKEHLLLYGALKGIQKNKLKNEIIKMLDKLELNFKINTKSKELSGGMKRKLSLAIAMIGEPKILVLDEPTAGMDPEARRAVWDLLLEVRQNMAILVTTHHMEEADVLGDRIAIMSEGLIRCIGSSMFLKRRFGAGYHLTFAKSDNYSNRKFKDMIAKFVPESMYVSETNTEITICLDPDYTFKLSNFFTEFDRVKKEIGISSCGITVTTMEDVFLQVGSTFKNLKAFVSPKITDYTVFIKRPQPSATIYRKKPLPRYTRFALTFQRLRGLFLKRLNYTLRYIPTMVNEIIIPAAMILILVELQNQMLDAMELAPFEIDLGLYSLYRKTFTFIHQSNEPESSRLFEILNNSYFSVLESEKTYLINLTALKKDPNEFMLQIANNDFNKYRKRFIIGASFQNKIEEPMIIAWYNGEALHSMPISINMVYKALQRDLLKSRFNKSGDIIVVNRPFPKEAFFRQWFVFANLARYLYFSFIPISMAFITAAFVLIPINERVSKAKLVQLMTGTNKFLFWFSHFVFDFSLHVIASLAFMLIFWFWDEAELFFKTSNTAIALFLVFVLYGFVMIPFVYTFSFASDTPSTGFAVVLMICLIFGLLLSYISHIFEFLVESGKLSSYYFDLLVDFGLLFPPFSLIWAMQKLFYSEASAFLCNKIQISYREIVCKTLSKQKEVTIKNLKGCCSEICEDACFLNYSPFSYGKYGINKELISFSVTCFIFWGLLLLIEGKAFANIKAKFEDLWIWRSLRSKFESKIESDSLSETIDKSRDDYIEDSDVIAEKKRVSQIISEKKLDSEAIVIDNLTKKFHKLTAVNSISLAIHKEEFFGFLGINGAGKSTTFGMLTGDIQPTEGNAFIGQTSLKKEPILYAKQIGYCPQFDPLLDRLTGKEMLVLMARLRGIKESFVEREVNHLLKLVDLEPHADKLTTNYSGGNQRKLSLAMALVGSPKVVFLDEPTAGVDAESRRKMWSTLIDLQAMTGCAIVLTSHTMDECEALCNRLTIMVNGKFRCLGSTQHLRSKFGQGFTVILKLRQEMISSEMGVEKVKDYMEKTFKKATIKDEHGTVIHYHIADKTIPWSVLFTNMEKAKRDLNLEDYQVGSDASLKPYMLCAHLDVVPVVRDQWKLDPFAGQIQDQFVNGRGSIDVKEMVIASLEALEFLLENSFKPKRSFYLAFGHDEEGMGLEGASEISNVMQKRKVDFEYLLDEGPVIVDGGFKGVPNLVAMVGVAEKGFVTFKLEVNGTTGHSSLPPAETAIVKLAKAVSKFHANTFPSRLGYGPEKDIFEFLAPYASFPYKLFYSNIWLFSPLLSYLLSLQPYTNSLIRTTTAVTVINGGLKENVLPSYSYALINHRIHPSQSVKEALEYDKKLINDAKVSVTINEGASFDPHPLSPYHSASFGFQAIKQSIREVFPQTIVVPGIMFASTDTKWYLKLTKNIYRFRPVVLKTNEFAMIHGHNEKISIDNYVKIKPADADFCSTKVGHKAIDGNEALIQRFSRALQFKTVTTKPHHYNASELIAFRAFIEKSFPRIHSSPFVKQEIVSKYTLLYTIKGSDPSLRPYMLCSHLDVVPVEFDKWDIDPFGGQIRDGYFYGRGAVDVKDTLMASLEALEFMLVNGFKPKRSFYLAYGHDEEGSGVEGAAAIANIMKLRNVQLEYILDEGTMIINNTFKGVDEPVALVGVSEKGYVTLKLEVNGTTGHSSLAPKETTIVTLANALSKFNGYAYPSRFGYGPEKAMFDALAPYASFPYNLIFGNLWLFGPLVSYILSQKPTTNSLIRTSTAVTIVNGGIKENVLPSYSSAIINHRIHPYESVKYVLDYDKNLINDDRISISINEATTFEPHPISPFDDETYGFQAIKRSVQEVFPKTIVAPGVMLASTDTKWYLTLTQNIYRFSPAIMQTEDLVRVHGHNERISVDNYVKVVNFYHHLILISDNEKLPETKIIKDEL
ncbi:ATP-binding cassette sub-family A member 1-like protein [Dinothrombium tinctorium]|uniref:ATP-binding cassette sub-family A member 1-like protein n=1 Tax=Dinothrombium tinctorium TaxID=1965070 RepID=A0A3S3QS52_9ACAR|nr:ATP-binding cassette sub-family A member 1-like protein [Dinothrombium tinctorium]